MRTHADACDACQPPWVKLMPYKKKALMSWCWQHPPAMANNFSDFICHGACLVVLPGRHRWVQGNCSTLWGLGVMSAQTGKLLCIDYRMNHSYPLIIYLCLTMSLYSVQILIIYVLCIYIYIYIRCTIVYAIVYNAHVSRIVCGCMPLHAVIQFTILISLCQGFKSCKVAQVTSSFTTRLLTEGTAFPHMFQLVCSPCTSFSQVHG